VKVCVSVDMDNYREYRSLVDPGGAEQDLSFYEDALPRFLDAFDRHGLVGTFFMVGRDASVPAHRRAAREIVARGHELGNHSWSHPYDLRSLPRERKREEIARAEEALADAVGERPVGFRCPSGELDAEILEILDERGYLYDATIFPTPFMWLFMLYGRLFVRHERYQLGEVTAVFAPRHPYLPSAARIHRERAPGAPGPGVVEIPFSTLPLLGLPFYATLFRMLPPAVFEAAARWHGRRRPALQMLFHLIDLVDLSDSPLGAALARTPGLGVPFARRARFVERALAVLARQGEPAPLREVARAFRARAGAP
jgi:peptidoglycan-N-acetylglucosamine deacetylase